MGQDGTPANAAIRITYNAANVGSIGANNQLLLTPYVRWGAAAANVSLISAAQGANQAGPIDWGCSSATSTVSSARSLPPEAAPPNPLAARFAPSECR
jgi:type IV pilus assembly protein PilA